MKKLDKTFYGKRKLDSGEVEYGEFSGRDSFFLPKEEKNIWTEITPEEYRFAEEICIVAATPDEYEQIKEYMKKNHSDIPFKEI